MRNALHVTTIASAVVLLAGLAACGSQPMNSTAPVSSYPSASYPAGSTAPGYVEYGRVTGIQVMRMQEPGSANGAAGAVIGGIAGAVLGHQIGRGTGRDLATIAGGIGGAVAGNAIQNNSTTQIKDSYRVSVQTDNGAVRSYDLSSAGDLRAGDRVRIENGQLYRL